MLPLWLCPSGWVQTRAWWPGKCSLQNCSPNACARSTAVSYTHLVPNIVLDALNVGMLMMGRKPEAEVEKAVMEFVTRYGLLGLMTALPTTPSFMDYEAVYLSLIHI